MPSGADRLCLTKQAPLHHREREVVHRLALDDDVGDKVVAGAHLRLLKRDATAAQQGGDTAVGLATVDE